MNLSSGKKFYFVIKSIVDFFISIIFLLVLSPIFIIVFLINIFDTKCRPFYRQKRYGYKRHIFYIYKFRSINENGHSSIWGRFIRFTSLDELPQLINILMFKMAFIGPRPLSILENDIDVARNNTDPNCYLVKPGLSGYAQVHFDSKSSIEQKANNDAYYVKHYSFLLDLKILFLTILHVVPITIHRK